MGCIARSRIRVSIVSEKLALRLPRPKSVDELAIDRADMRTALETLSRGELTAVLRRFGGFPLNSGQRVQLMRAFEKTRELRKRFPPAVRIVIEGGACPPSGISNERNENQGGLNGA